MTKYELLFSFEWMPIKLLSKDSTLHKTKQTNKSKVNRLRPRSLKRLLPGVAFG
jgi:hypothetical protein